MMEWETFPVRGLDGTAAYWLCVVGTSYGVYIGQGFEEHEAKVSTFAKAAEESDEARYEFGILTGALPTRKAYRYGSRNVRSKLEQAETGAV